MFLGNHVLFMGIKPIAQNSPIKIEIQVFSLIFVMIYCQFSVRVETTSFAKTTNIKQGFFPPQTKLKLFMRKLNEYLKVIGLGITFSNFFYRKRIKLLNLLIFFNIFL